MIFDTHAHYDDKAFDEDRHELLSSMNSNGVKRIVNVGANLSGSERSIELSREYDFIYAAVGVHPDDAAEITQEGLAKLYEMTQNDKVVAIGEIGLDYYWNKENKEVQAEAFIKQIDLAKESGLPIIVHSREAAEDTMKILREKDAAKNGGVIHCFSYSKEIAKEAIAMGFNIGIGGVLTFSNAKKVKETVAEIPIERIVLETDCPYLAPVPYRGERNNSTYISRVVEEIARIKNLTAEEVMRVTYDNACKMYRL